MVQKSIIFSVLIFPLFLLGIFLGTPALASAKTVYVNQDGDDSNDGSADHPFETLEEAAEEVNEGEADEIKIGKGSFSGDVTFDQGVSIQGSSKGSTTLKGSLTFKKKVTLKDLSVNTKARYAVTIGKNSVASLKDVDIRGYTGIGVWAQSGGAELTIEDSRIGSASGKGIYAESGTKLTLVGNSIVNNGQEGVDIRQNTRGTIKNNTIEDNDESGIELIIGSSDFVISGNKIKNNNASGIAFQFYELKKKLGTIVARDNVISGSRKYGIDCNKPQAGDTPVGYWADSISLEENTFSSNKLKDISTNCKLIEAKTEEEEAELEKEVIIEEKAEVEDILTETPDQQAQEKINQENQAAEESVVKIENSIQEDQYKELLRQGMQQKWYQTLWYRGKNAAFLRFQEQISIDTNEILANKEQLSASGAYAARADLQERVAAQEQKLVQYKEAVQIAEQKKNPFKNISEETIRIIPKLLYVFIF